MDDRFFELLTAIAERLDHDWTTKEMAVFVGLGDTQFRNLFNDITLYTPTRYLKEARLQRSRHLIETTREHIDQIGFQVGLRDHSHFTRGFKKKFGLTPTEYRSQYQEKRQAEILIGQKSVI